MDHFLNWYSQNNKNVILVLSTVIGLGLIYFLYRMLFASQAAEENISKKSVEAPREPVETKKATPVEESAKIHAAIANEEVFSDSANAGENATIKGDESHNETGGHATATSSASFNGEAAASSSEASVAAQEKSVLDDARIKALQEQLDSALSELKQSKAEISRSQRDAAAAQDELSQIKNKIKNQSDNGNDIQYVDTTKLEGDEAMIKRIDELQNKLQEYDIISDDISELQNLRKINAELTKQLAEKS
jgi:hypothetical protein